MILLAVIATIVGIALIGNGSPFEVGCCFIVAAAAYFFTAYLSLKKQMSK